MPLSFLSSSAPLRPIGALCALLLGLAAHAALAADAEQALGPYLRQCEARDQGDAMYACALERSTKARALAPETVAACGAEIPQAAPSRATQVWKCATRRQYARTSADADWWLDTGSACMARSRTPGHAYERRLDECVIDAAITTGKVTPEQLQSCRAAQPEPSPRQLRNCLQRAARAQQAGQAVAPAPAVAGRTHTHQH